MPRRQKNKNERFRRQYEIIKTWMSSFAVTVVAAVAAVTLIPSSPKATIIKAEALTNEIIYQVSVTDQDQALDLETLFVVLENQMEYYEVPISLGENAGYFDELNPNTEYRLSVYGSKGFGQERLDSVVLTTEESTGGAILGYQVTGDEFDSIYIIDVKIHDPESIYENVILYYGFSWEPEMPIDYQEIIVTESLQSIELTQIFTSSPFHVYLEGLTSEGPVLLDEIWITPEFTLSSSLYLDRINQNEIYLSLYPDSYSDVDVMYQIEVYKGNQLIDDFDVSLHQVTGFYLNVPVSGLAKNTTYTIIGKATYINPGTLREETKIIYEEEVTTLDTYSIDFSIVEVNGFLEVTITVVDPNHYFQIPYYDIFELTGDHPIYLGGDVFDFTPSVESKSVSFTISIPSAENYQITIGIRNQQNYLIRHILYDEIHE
ncbi:MAG: hypothetical protein C4537_06600 [Acholeplasma sp.]|nr:MAG: hypothetical protein C4537_06600 [Acholeplasma sp.]